MRLFVAHWLQDLGIIAEQEQIAQQGPWRFAESPFSVCRPNVAGVTQCFPPSVRLSPFRFSFEGKEDIELGQRLSEEIAGITNWALRGLVDLRNSGGFVQPKAGQAFPYDLAGGLLHRTPEDRSSIILRYPSSLVPVWENGHGQKPSQSEKLSPLPIHQTPGRGDSKF